MMRALAEYIMRGPAQARIATVVLASLPLLLSGFEAGNARILLGLAATALISLSAAAVALVTLRRGVQDGVMLLCWGLLPALLWLFVRDEGSPLALMVVSLLLAITLRYKQSWGQTLMLASGLGALVSLTLEWTAPATVAGVDRIAGELARVLLDQNPQLAAFAESNALREVLMGGLIAGHLTSAFSSLLIARWWQAMLYNPGGLAVELRQLKLPATFGLLTLMVMLATAGGSEAVLRWLPLLLLPLIAAGMALVHAVVAIKKLGRSWLIAFYSVTFLAGPYLLSLLVILAIADSLIDFRRRLAAAS